MGKMRRDQSEDQGLKLKIISQLIFGKQVGSIGTGIIWIRRETSGGHL